MADDINNGVATTTSTTADGNAGGATNTAGQGANDEWFLDVGDGRTRYKTKDDAIKAYSSAGQRIASLSGWERTAKEYGINDPRQLGPLFDELIGHRSERSKANQATKPAATPQEAEREEVKKFLKEWAEENGFVRKDALEPLQQNLQTLNDEQFNARVSDGRSALKSMLDEAKLPTDPKFASMVEDYLRAYIDADPERIQAFYQGGSAMREMLKAGFMTVTEAMGVFQAGGAATAAGNSAAYADGKNKAQAAAGKPLPQQGISSGGNSNGQAAPTKQGFTSEVNDKAWELFKQKSGTR